MRADFSLSIVDFFRVNFPFNHIIFSIVVIWEMSQKKNTGRDFKIDLGDSDDDVDFQSEDDFENMETVQNLTLADLLGQSNRRREENYRREREQRRAETKQNTVTNAGDFICFYFAVLLIVS